MEQAAEERERREGSAWPQTQTQHRCSNTLKSLGAKCQSPAPVSKPARIAPRHVGEQHLLSMSCPWVKQREWPWLLAGKRCVGFRKTGDKEEQGREEGAEWKSQWEHLLCLRSIRSSSQPGHHGAPSASTALSQLQALPSPHCHCLTWNRALMQVQFWGKTSLYMAGLQPSQAPLNPRTQGSRWHNLELTVSCP